VPYFSGLRSVISLMARLHFFFQLWLAFMLNVVSEPLGTAAAILNPRPRTRFKHRAHARHRKPLGFSIITPPPAGPGRLPPLSNLSRRHTASDFAPPASLWLVKPPSIVPSGKPCALALPVPPINSFRFLRARQSLWSSAPALPLLSLLARNRLSGTVI